MKMKALFLLFLASLLLILTQCNNEIAEPRQADFDCSEALDVCKLTNDQNAFGFDIFQKLHEAKPDDNIFISPMSISTALSMALNGAANQTQSDMQGTMQIPDWTLAQLNTTYKKLLEVLPNLDREVKLQLANSIWYRSGYAVKQDFLDINKAFYNSQVQSLDFNAPVATDAINSWVNDKTEGVIKSIIEEIPAETVMYIINAIYFKGTWRYEFDPKDTRKQPFYLANGTQKQVDMMLQSDISLPIFFDENFKAVDLPYGDSIFSMMILLPNEGYSLDAMIGSLCNTNWNTWINNFRNSPKMTFSMPKFKMEYEQELNQSLTDLGMGIAFLPNQADFTNIANDKKLYISVVKHKAFVEVDEKGTKAAAVTSIGIDMTSISSLTINRPFVFVIRDNKTNSVLFIGKVMNP